MDTAAPTLSEAELRELDERNAITELLFYASRGHVARMQSVIASRGLKVRTLHHSRREAHCPLTRGFVRGGACVCGILLSLGFLLSLHS